MKMHKNCNLDARKLLEWHKAVREDTIKVDLKETGYKSVNWINMAWDECWRRVFAKMTMLTLVTMRCSVKT